LGKSHKSWKSLDTVKKKILKSPGKTERPRAECSWEESIRVKVRKRETKTCGKKNPFITRGVRESGGGGGETYGVFDVKTLNRSPFNQERVKKYPVVVWLGGQTVGDSQDEIKAPSEKTTN